MKKSLVFLLATVLVVTSMLFIFVACETPVESIRIENAPSSVTHWDTVDYSEINLVATLEGGAEKTFSLTDKSKGVTYDPIDTSTLGFKTLTARYGGLSTQVTVEVVEVEIDLSAATFLTYENTAGYRAYLDAIKEKSNKQTEFYDRTARYQVGTTNGYRLLPVATVMFEGHPYSVQSFNTTYKLSIWDGSKFDEVSKESEPTYLEKVENNVYYFTKSAENEVFKLEVTLDESYTALVSNKTVVQEFEVVDGYNVYNALGLSVLDNLNIKSWAGIKQTKLAWDNGKALSQFTDVSQVILHNEIIVTASDLPANYFWQKGEDAQVDSNGERRGISYQDAFGRSFGSIRKYLEGSLKENYLGEDWEVSYNEDAKEGEAEFEPKTNNQRALYMSNGIGVSGNYLKLGYKSEFDENNPTARGIYIVHDYKQTSDKADNTSGYPEAHTSLIGYTNVLDKFQTKAEDESSHTRTVQNVYFVGDTQRTENTSGKPCGIMMMHTNMYDVEIRNTIGTSWFGNFEMERHSSVVLDHCKFYDSFSQMVYAYALKSVDVIHSEMMVAGGPLFIVQDAPSDDDVNIQFNIDDFSIQHMESWLSGAEMWFTINNVPNALMQSLFSYATMSDLAGTSYRSYIDESKTGFKVNAILVFIPSPGDLMTNQKAIKGSFTISNGDSKTTYASVAANLNPLATKGADLASRTNTVLGGSNSDMLEMIATFNALAQQTADLRLAPIYQCGNNYAYLDNKGLNSFNSTIGNIYSLVGGKYEKMLGLAQILAGMGEDELAEEWTNFAAMLKPAVDATVSEQDDWSAGHLAAWINPMAPDDASIRHFMLLLSESKTTA